MYPYLIVIFPQGVTIFLDMYDLIFYYKSSFCVRIIEKLVRTWFEAG